jgi:Cu-Zn family superoxide dismutase
MPVRALRQTEEVSTEMTAPAFRSHYGRSNRHGGFIRIAALIGLALTTTVASARDSAPGEAAELQDARGAVVGMVLFGHEDAVVHLRGAFRNLPPGVHGIHMQAVGSCAPAFRAAGPRFNRGSKQRGRENWHGAHDGKLPNLVIDAGGSGIYDVKAPLGTLGSAADSLFDPGGSAIVVHAKPDDNKTAAGGRSSECIACGMITRIGAATPSAGASALPDKGQTSAVLSLLALAAASAGAGIGGMIGSRARRA